MGGAKVHRRIVSTQQRARKEARELLKLFNTPRAHQLIACIRRRHTLTPEQNHQLNDLLYIWARYRNLCAEWFLLQ